MLIYSFLERAQRTLQSIIYKYIESTGSETFIGKLPELVKTFNSRINRSIKMSPVKAEKQENFSLLLQNVVANYDKTVNEKKKKKILKQLKPGDKVRIWIHKNVN